MAEAPKGKKVVCDGDTCKLVDDDKADNSKLSIDDPAPEEKKDDAAPAEGAKFIKLLGDKLTGKDGEVNTADLVKNDAVGLYFSAHWCPPCRGFTPQLAKIYKGLKDAGKKLEIVFVSSDKDDAAFKDYHKEMPWLALPYADRKRKAKLSTKYGVQGIPTLVFVDPKTGKTLTDDGRSAVMGDQEGKNFPWKKPTLAESVKGDTKILTQDGDTTMAKLWEDNKYLILYFSAHWCPPCRGFTPTFAEWYKNNQAKKKGTDQAFDVVFVSSDRDQKSFDEYFKEMPWKALDYPLRDLKGKLSDACGVQGIPTVAVVDKNWNIVTTKGRAGVSKDKDCENFPWIPDSILDFNEEPSDINSYPSVILMMENDEEADQKTKKAALKKVANARKAACEADDEKMDMRFFYVSKEGNPSTQLKKILNLGDCKDVTVVFADLGSETKTLFKGADDCTEEGLNKIVKSILDESIKTVGMKE